MIISVSANSLLEIGDNLKNYSNDMNNEIKKISGNLEKLKVIWKGKDADNYFNFTNNEMIVNLNELSSIVNEYGIYLQKVAEAYELLDNEFASKNIEG